MCCHRSSLLSATTTPPRRLPSARPSSLARLVPSLPLSLSNSPKHHLSCIPARNEQSSHSTTLSSGEVDPAPPQLRALSLRSGRPGHDQSSRSRLRLHLRRFRSPAAFPTRSVCLSHQPTQDRRAVESNALHAVRPYPLRCNVHPIPPRCNLCHRIHLPAGPEPNLAFPCYTLSISRTSHVCLQSAAARFRIHHATKRLLCRPTASTVHRSLPSCEPSVSSHSPLSACNDRET